jgi:hypothetical protein
MVPGLTSMVISMLGWNEHCDWMLVNKWIMPLLEIRLGVPPPMKMLLIGRLLICGKCWMKSFNNAVINCVSGNEPRNGCELKSQ